MVWDFRRIAVLLGCGLLLVACGDESGGSSGGAGGNGQGQSGTKGQGSTPGGGGQGATSGKGGSNNTSGSGGAGATGGSGGSLGGDGGTSQCGNCQGCCDGSKCLPLAAQNDFLCGQNGAQCAVCSAGDTCETGKCTVNKEVCSPSTCPTGCCLGNECYTGTTWQACGLPNGGTCETCEPMAACTSKKACNNDLWDDNALIDLYLDNVTVSGGQCSDPGGLPDPIVSVVANNKAYGASCNDVYSCTFTAPLKIPSLTLAQLKGGILIEVSDTDLSSDDSCWSGTLSVSQLRDLGKYALDVGGGGSITYHLRPAGY